MASPFDAGAFDPAAFDADGGVAGWSASDTVSLSEAANSTAALSRGVVDTVSASDSLDSIVTPAAGRVSDATSVADVVSRALAAVRSTADTQHAADSLQSRADPLRAVDSTVTGDFVLPLVIRSQVPIDPENPVFQTSLSAAVLAGGDGVDVISASFNVVPFTAEIDGEAVVVTAVSGTSWTLSGPLVGGHGAGSPVTYGFSGGAGGQPRPILTQITVDGADITPFVQFSNSSWTTYGNGQPGTGTVVLLRTPDLPALASGMEMVVRYRGIRVWGGYIETVSRTYAFPSGSGRGATEPGFITLGCVDYNILFRRRIFFDQADPTNMEVKHWPNGTADSTVLAEVVSRFVDLSADGLSFDITHVGTPAIPTDSCNPDAPDEFGVGSAGWAWGDVMDAVAQQTGAVYYIDPDRVLRYVDDATAQSAFGYDGLSDAPAGTMIGYREMELSFDGTQLVNDQYTWGVGQGADHPVLGHVTDSASIDAHGLWQNGELRYDMYCQDSVDMRAESWIYGSPQNRRGGKDPRIVARCTVFVPYFRVADVVQVEVSSHGFSQPMPLRGMEISFPTPWDIRCVITASHEIDAPWSAYEFMFPDLSLPDFRLPGLPSFDFLPPVFPPFDPCWPVLSDVCRETFTRTEASGWGTSEITPFVWAHPGGTSQFSVDGDEGVIIGTASREALLEDFHATLPFETTVYFRMDRVDTGVRQLLEIGLFGPSYAAGDFWASAQLRIMPSSDPILDLNGGNTTGSFGLVSTSAGVVPFNADVAMKLRIEEGGASAKVWVVGDSEPDWQLTITGDLSSLDGDNDYEVSGFSDFISPPADNAIRITEIVVPCGDGGGSGSSSACAIDDFEGRTNGPYTVTPSASVSGVDLGTTRVGPWTNVFAGMPGYNYTPGTGSIGVQDGTLNVNLGAGTGNFEASVDLVDAGTTDPYEIIVAFSFDHVPLTTRFSEYLELYVQCFSGGGGVSALTADIFVRNSGDALQPPIWSWNGSSDIPWSASIGVMYILRMQADRANLVGRAKLWASDAPEPDWQAELPITDDWTPGDLTLQIAIANSADRGDSFAEYDYIYGWKIYEVTDNSACDPCADALPGDLADPALSGPAQEVLTCRYLDTDGKMLFATKYQFQPNSTEVWMDGIRLRLGIDYDEDWRNRHILLHPELGVTDCATAPVISASYRIWTVERPELIEGA